MFIEKRRDERGHSLYPSMKDLAAIPSLNGTEQPAPTDKVVHLHYFTADHDWCVVERIPAAAVVHYAASVSQSVYRRRRRVALCA